ncbi:hypothetical protein MTR67_037301 [Solanum verrucosum]|uniref:Uncharacterized protein n=1 Tax=Solanum verrucosum TaxID=315347 RepID=A0AAF0UE97_SOLVR|nr:hypothetical protein MTR67_037301 [Solanum verrucosum]
MLKSVMYPVNEVQNIDDPAGIFGWVVVLEHSQPHSWVSHWGPNTRQCLLLKCLRRCISEDRVLWKEVIVTKYGEASLWCTEMVTDTYGMGVWRTIRNLWKSMEANICLQVDNGARTKFWRDSWIEQTSLKEAFPDPFRFFVDPEFFILSKNFSDAVITPVEYCEKYAKKEDAGAPPEEKSSDEELSEEENVSSDDEVAGKADP